MIIDLINVNSTRGSIFLFKLIVCGKTAFLRIIEKVNNCNLAVLPSLNLIIFTLTDENAKLPVCLVFCLIKKIVFHLPNFKI